MVDIGGDWDAYFACLSGNHRSSVRRAEKQARRAGELEVQRLSDLTAEETERYMHEVFRIENESWKADNASSILASEGMVDYFLQEAEIARQAGMLELWFLLLDGRPIAFEYCHRCKGVCLSYKIGYDQEFRKFAPGKVLRKLQLETLHQQDPGSILDTQGVLCEAKAKWVTRTFETGCLTASLGGTMAGAFVKGMRQARPLIRKLRGIPVIEDSIALGGQSYASTCSL